MRLENLLLLDTPTASLSESAAANLDHYYVADVVAVITGANATDQTFIDTDVDATEDTVTIEDHGYLTGTLVTLTTTDTLPTGLLVLTNYYIIVVDEDTIQFASSQANALAGTAIGLTADGMGTHTVVVTTALAGSVKLQKNSEPDTVEPIWFDVANSSNSFTAAETMNWTLTDIGFRTLRAVVTTTSGTVNAYVRVNAKGA